MAKEKEQAQDSLEDVLAILENEKKASQGKDQKISQLLAEKKELEEQLAKTGEETSKSGEQLTERMTQVRELFARLEEQQNYQEAQKTAIDEAVKLGVPLGMAARNPFEWEQTKKEITELAEDIFKGKDYIDRGKPGGNFKMKVKKEYHKENDGLTAAHIGRMTRGELSRLPDYILRKFEGGKL